MSDTFSETISTTIAPEDGRGQRAYYILFAIICLTICLPFWFVQYAPLVDYPNHLARAYILHHYDDVQVYKATYDTLIEPIPNIAMDLIVPLLLKVFELEVASKIFLSLTVLLFAAGCHMLGRAIHGANSWIALACALFSYNSMLLYGFVNFVFGMGAFMVTLAFWLRRRKDWNITTLTAMSVLAFATYLSHLSAYCFLGLTLVIITLFDYLSTKRLSKNMALGLSPLVPPLVTFAIFMRGSGQVGVLYWNTAIGKIIGLLSLVVSYNYSIDVIAAVLLLATAIALVFYSKQLEITRAMFAAACCFAALFLLCPKTVFTAWGADARFVPPAVILALMALRFKVNKRVGTLAFLLFIVVSMIRIGSIGYTWTKIDQSIKTEVEMFSCFKEGDRVYPIVFLSTEPQKNKIERAFEHSIHYSTIYRHTFSPTLFAIPGQQPLLIKNHPEYVNLSADVPPEEVDWKPIFDGYDYLWCYGLDENYREFLKGKCSLVADANNMMVFRVESKNRQYRAQITRGGGADIR